MSPVEATLPAKKIIHPLKAPVTIFSLLRKNAEMLPFKTFPATTSGNPEEANEYTKESSSPNSENKSCKSAN
jgi:hypothetical protein